MKKTRELLVEVQASLDPDSPIWVNLNLALAQFTDTAQSVGQLSDYLQQNPSALVRGRYVPNIRNRSTGMIPKLIVFVLAMFATSCSPLAPCLATTSSSC